MQVKGDKLNKIYRKSPLTITLLFGYIYNQYKLPKHKFYFLCIESKINKTTRQTAKYPL